MTIAFLHVPKTAGTSYTDFLSSSLPGEQWIELHEHDEATAWTEQVDPEQLRGLSFVAGHVGWRLVERAPFVRPVCVLREPVDRLVSWYHHVKQSDLPGDAPWRRLIEGRDLSVEGFVTNPGVQRVCGQVMTEQLAGWGRPDAPDHDPDAQLARAVDHLGRLAHLGLFEDLPASLALAACELDLASPAPLRHLNPGRGPDPLPAEVRAAAAPGLALDHALYQAAVAELDRRLAAHGLHRSDRAAAAPGPEPEPRPRPPAVRTSKRPRARRGHDGVGDRIELSWQATESTVVGALLGDRPSAAALPVDVVDLVDGPSYAAEAHGEGGSWVCVPAGLHHVSVCLALDAGVQPAPWTLLLVGMWCASPPIPGAPGIPGNPDVERWTSQLVPVDLPERPLRGPLLTAELTVPAPEDDGHLYVALGTSVPVRVQPPDVVQLTVVRLA